MTIIWAKLGSPHLWIVLGVGTQETCNLHKPMPLQHASPLLRPIPAPIRSPWGRFTLFTATTAACSRPSLPFWDRTRPSRSGCSGTPRVRPVAQRRTTSWYGWVAVFGAVGKISTPQLGHNSPWSTSLHQAVMSFRYTLR